MNSRETLHEDMQAVQAHLAMMQAVILRMATNSTSAKSWCIAMVSAILVLVADKGRGGYANISYIPLVLFLGLDAYYLSLEKRFRDAYNGFVASLHAGELKAEDLYVILPKAGPWGAFGRSLASLSIWPFYATLAVTIPVARVLVLEIAK